MARSMTGFGSHRASLDGEELTIEVKSVNHKFCEVKVRTPRELSVLESQLVKQVKASLARGAIDVSVKLTRKTSTGLLPRLDEALAEEYARTFRQLAQVAGLTTEMSVRDLAAQPGVVTLDEPALNPERLLSTVEAALIVALERLNEMRTTEGAALQTDLLQRLEQVERWVNELKAAAPNVILEYQRRLKQRIAELTEGMAIDPQRLVQEVALFAERTDVAEEMTRLNAHLQQFRSLLTSAEPSGRKLDFLVQEMHREVNTTGSKSQSTEISGRIVDLKAELERIREQVQNIE